MSKLKLLILSVLFLPSFVFAGTRSEFNINQDGKVIAKNIKVQMISEPGKSKFFFARAYWGDAYIKLTILTSDSTVITKNHGEKSSVFDIQEGDLLDIEGMLPDSSEALNIQATKIIDNSLLKETKEVKGTVTEVKSELPGFAVKTAKGNVITVKLSGDTAITKGVRTITLSEISKGDTINSAKGVFDYSAYSMDASTVDVYQDKSVFKARNFEGTLKSVSGTDLPVTLVMTVNGKDYTVYLNSKASVLNKNKEKVGLSRFVTGDKIRVYGSIRQTNLSEMDADTARDMNF